MIGFSTLFGYVLMFGALLIPGYLMGKFRRVDAPALRGITNILTDVAMPFLVFVKLIETDLSEIAPIDAVVGLLLPCAFIFLMYALSFVFYRKDDLQGRACSIFTNCGFLSLPLAAAVFPHDTTAVFVSLFNLVHSFLILTLGTQMFSKEKQRIGIRTLLLKPITLSILLGVLCSVLGIGERFPASITYSNYLAMLCTPLSMFVIGAEMSRFPLKKIFTQKVVYYTGMLKLIFAPLLMMLIVAFLKYGLLLPLSKELALGMFLSAAASGGTVVSVIARGAGHDAERATVQILASTVFCIITIPLMSFVFEWIF